MTLTELLVPVVRERAITGLTGGTPSDLDGIVTVGLSLTPQPLVNFAISNALYSYILRAGTDAESSPTIIRPDDYAGGTNEKVWALNSAGAGDMVSTNNLSDVASPSSSRANLGLAIGTNVQAWAANLDAWALLATSAKLTTSSNLSDVASASTARTNLGLAIGTDVQAYSANLAAWSALATSAKLTTASNLSDVANAGTARTNLGVAIGSDVQAWSANLDAWSLIATSSKQAALGYTPANVASNLSDLANAGTARTNLGLAIGSDVQAYSANLAAWSALATSTKLTTASNLSDVASASTARTNLGLAIGTNVQAWSTNLDSWSALATSSKLSAASNLSDVGNATLAASNLGLITGVTIASQSDMSTAQTAITNLKKTNLVFVIDGGGVAITTGSKGCIRVPAAMTITGWEIFGDVSGSIVVDIKRATYSNLPTFTAISASAQPTLSAAQKANNTTLTGWTTSLADGDWIEFNVASASTVARVTVAIYGNRT